MKNFLILILFLPLVVCSQQLAFPEAEGFGRFTSGGRGGEVYIVTNLSDNLSSPKAGTLRWAINQKGARTIVFATSGTIGLEGPLRISNGDLTIAGQTAPGDGICIKDYVVILQGNNMILRHLRFRCGNDKLKDDTQDAMNGKDIHNIVIDHCSLSWSIDEAGSFYDTKDFTMQWCILSESLYNAGHHKGPHGFGGIWGGQGASFHHNLLADHTSRNPRFCGSRYTKNPQAEIVDFRNNVIFNWGFKSAYGGEGGSQNMVNNYYKPGPATKKERVRSELLNLTDYFYDPGVRPDTLWAGKYYVDGNVLEGNEKVKEDNWLYGVVSDAPEKKQISKASSPFPFATVTTQTAEEAYNAVLSKAGATLPKRDSIDRRMVQEVKTGVCKYGDSWGEHSGIIDTQGSVGGWPELKTYNIKKDHDKDGIPDIWEKKHGLNPKNKMDGNGDQDKDGYTNLEEYLNSIP